MPYLKQEDRSYWNNFLYELLAKAVFNSAGELNYIFTRIIQAYVKSKGECYQTYNDVLGALEGCKLELYRRKIAELEDRKIIENGDV